MSLTMAREQLQLGYGPAELFHSELENFFLAKICHLKVTLGIPTKFTACWRDRDACTYRCRFTFLIYNKLFIYTKVKKNGKGKEHIPSPRSLVTFMCSISYLRREVSLHHLIFCQETKTQRSQIIHKDNLQSKQADLGSKEYVYRCSFLTKFFLLFYTSKSRTHFAHRGRYA